jgi:hypothetical protein
MNIFVEDDDGDSGVTGLPGNETNAVLHTSFTSNRSSTGTSSVNSVSTQSSAGQAVESRRQLPGHSHAFPSSESTLHTHPVTVSSTSTEGLRSREISQQQVKGALHLTRGVATHQQIARQHQFSHAPLFEQPPVLQLRSQEPAFQRAPQPPTLFRSSQQQSVPPQPLPFQLTFQHSPPQDRVHQQGSLPQSTIQPPHVQGPTYVQPAPQQPIVQQSIQQKTSSKTSERSQEKAKVMDDTKAVRDSAMEQHKVTQDSKATEQGKAADKGNGKESCRDTRTTIITSAPQSFGSQGEEITEEETAFAAKAQKVIDKDEETIKRDMELYNRSIKPPPTASDAAKARSGLSKEEFASEMKISIEELEENEQKLDAAEKERASMCEDTLATFGLLLDAKYLMDDAEPPLEAPVKKPTNEPVKMAKANQDFFDAFSNYPEIMMEMAKFLKPKDLIKLYSISKPFNEIIGCYLSHTMQLAAKTQAPESAVVFKFKFYGDLCQLDPGLRPNPRQETIARLVPSPRWLQMVVHRERIIRDILALLARQGLRMPKDMSLSLKKMWLIMDVATTRQRVQLLHSPYFTDKDIFNMQMFMVKLDMRFNDPFDGPGNDKLRKLMLGQRGLTPLCNLLKRKIGLTPMEVNKIGIRYAYWVEPKFRGLPLFDIPPEEIGIGHLEGWGKGVVHLLRPDELVIREAVRRRLQLRHHILGMMIWGYVDPLTGENIKVTDEEMYMSEDESEEEEYDVWNDDWDTDSDGEGEEIPKIRAMDMPNDMTEGG